MREKMVQKLVLLAFLAIALATAGVVSVSAQQQGTPPPPSKFKLMSPAYTEGSMIPTQYSCADPNAGSPALQWSNPPAAAMSFAVIFHDSDAAPNKGSMDVTHWIFWNIPGTSTAVPAGVKVDASPDGIDAFIDLFGPEYVQLAVDLGVDPDRVELEHVGLNHLTWARSAVVDGVDRMPELLERFAPELELESGVPAGLLRLLGALPSYYLHYYYERDREFAAQQLPGYRPAPKWWPSSSRNCSSSTATRRS